MSLKSLIFSFIVNSATAGRDVIPFTHLQVSSPMTVEVVTDTSQSQVSLDIAADGMGLGWTVKASVEPMTFGRTLLLGMDERAARQGFHWPPSSGQATLRVPEALTEVSATGGAQVLVDVVTSALLADSKSNLTVTKFVTANENRWLSCGGRRDFFGTGIPYEICGDGKSFPTTWDVMGKYGTLTNRGIFCCQIKFPTFMEHYQWMMFYVC